LVHVNILIQHVISFMTKNIKALIVCNGMHKVDKSYESLLSRIQGDLANASKKDSARLEIPTKEWAG